MSNMQQTFEELQPFDNRLSSNAAFMLVSHKDASGKYHSNAISMDDLARCLNSALSGIKSAAYCASSDFALSSHDHDIYTSATYISQVSPSNARTVMQIVDLTHGNASYSIDVSSIVDGSEVPASKKNEIMDAILPYLPKLGTIEFMCTRDVSSYNKYRDYFNIASKSFIGWTYANGQTYDMTSFILSDDFSNVFQCTGTSFTLPSLSNYICKANCQLDSSSYGHVQGEPTPLVGHSHTITNNSGNARIMLDSSDINVSDEDMDKMFENKIGKTSSGFTPKFKFTANSSTDNKWYLDTYKKFVTIHNGQSSGKTYTVELADEQHIEDQPLNGLAIVPEDGVENESAYPSHMLMPAVIYVGPSISSDFIDSYMS